MLPAPLAGDTSVGVFGGSGTKTLVSGDGPVLFHLRSQCARSHCTIVASVVNRLCSSCEAAEGLVQFEDPKIPIPCERSRTSFSWLTPLWLMNFTDTPAVYNRSTLYECHSRSGFRYSVGSVISRTGTPRFFAAMIALVWLMSVMRNMLTSMPTVSAL